MGTRYTANTLEPTLLSFQFIVNGVATDAYSVDKVTIHATRDDADADTGIIQTIVAGEITRTSTGTYTYTCNQLTTAKDYYDKVFITPNEGEEQITFVNTFIVSAPSYDIDLPGEPGTCKITGKIIDQDGQPLFCARVHAILVNPPSNFTQGVYIFHSTHYVDENGYFELDLIRGGQFTIIIREIGLMETILVPDQASCDLWSLIVSPS